MRALAAFVVGAVLAAGLPSLAHQVPIDGADHHEDCDEEVWSDRPGWWMVDYDWSAIPDPDSPHDAIEVHSGVCLSDVRLLHVVVEVFQFEDRRWTLTAAHAANWHVGDDGLAVRTLTHLEPETYYKIRLRWRGGHIGDRETVTAATPTEATPATTTTLPPCVMPTTTTTVPTKATVPGVIGEGLSRAQAEQRITAAGLVPAGIAVPSSSILPAEDGFVLFTPQVPALNTVVVSGSAVMFEYYQYVPPTTTTSPTTTTTTASG